MDLCGTMKVYIRQKPGSDLENNQTKTQVSPKSVLSNTHAFDKVFAANSNQDLIFRCSVKRMILNVLDGYNITAIAYGPIQSGKTYTVFGGPDITETEHAGLIPRSLGHIFDVLEEEQLEYLIQVSYLDIYNEQLFDLLSPNNDDTELNITDDILQEDCVIIQGLTEVTVNNMIELYDILQKGAEKRVNSSALRNSLSSERHSLFYVSVCTKEECINGETVLKRGRLIFVDVAACDYSEQFDGTIVELEDTKYQSLNTFNECLSKLANKSEDIPYGESKLTQLLQESLGGCTRTIIFGTMEFSSLEANFAICDFLYTAKRIETKPWIRHVFKKNTVIEKYTTEIDNLHTDIVNMCANQNTTPIMGDMNIVLQELEENQRIITDKIRVVKILKEIKNRWLKVYNNFENTEPEEEDITEMSESEYFESAYFKTFLSRYAEENIEVGNKHFKNVNSQVEIINKQLNKLCARSRLFRKNFNQSVGRMSEQMNHLKQGAHMFQQFLNSNKMSLQNKNQKFADNWTKFKDFFDNSNKIVNAGLMNSEDIVGLLCTLSASLDHLHIIDELKNFEQKSYEFIAPCIKDLTDHKEYVSAVGNNISESIQEITITGQQYIDTSRQTFSENQKSLTDSIELQKTYRMDFEEKFKNAVDVLKQMKSSSELYYKKTNEQSQVRKNNLEARRVSLTQSKNMINTWQRQNVMKVNTFAQNVTKNRQTQIKKLADIKKLMTETNKHLEEKITKLRKAAEILDISVVDVLYQQEKNFFLQEEKLRTLSVTYFRDYFITLHGLTLRIGTRIGLEETDKNKLIQCSGDFIPAIKALCSEKKTRCTYLINKIDHGLEVCKLARIEHIKTKNVFPSCIPPAVERNEESEKDDCSDNSSVTVVPEPNLETVKCELPKNEGTLRERSKKRKRASRKRRKLEEKANKDSSKSEVIGKDTANPAKLVGKQKCTNKT